MKIYHNPRCTKSRQGLALLQNSGVDFEIIEYLKTPLTKDELKDLLQKLGIPASELIRKNEAIWKEQFKNKDLTEAELIDAMIEFPKLIERPIVVHGNTAVIGRPTENISAIL